MRQAERLAAGVGRRAELLWELAQARFRTMTESDRPDWDSKVAAFISAVDALMVPEYGITWQDADGDRAPIERALRDGESPREFVDWFARKYDFVPVRDPW